MHAVLAQVVDTADPLTIGGFVDVFHAWNFHGPADHASFTAGTGSTAKRAIELSLNLAALDVAYDEAPVSARLPPTVGTGTQVIHAGEPAGVAVGPEVWDAIHQAYLGCRVPVGRGLQVDGGVFPCQVGFDGDFAHRPGVARRRTLALVRRRRGGPGGRHDRSTANVFSTDETAADGSTVPGDRQTLLVLGGVAAFQEGGHVGFRLRAADLRLHGAVPGLRPGLRPPVGASMSIDHLLGIAACALLAGYLVYALLRPERF
jgi:K+-transporting ATPase KdpF subunit